MADSDYYKITKNGPDGDSWDVDAQYEDYADIAEISYGLELKTLVDSYVAKPADQNRFVATLTLPSRYGVLTCSASQTVDGKTQFTCSERNTVPSSEPFSTCETTHVLELDADKRLTPTSSVSTKKVCGR